MDRTEKAIKVVITISLVFFIIYFVIAPINLWQVMGRAGEDWSNLPLYQRVIETVLRIPMGAIFWLLTLLVALISLDIHRLVSHRISKPEEKPKAEQEAEEKTEESLD